MSGGRSARAAADALASLAEELRPADPERSLELGSELLAVTTAFSQLRAGLAAQLQRFRDQARGHPGFEAVARIHSAYEQLLRGEPAAAAMDEVQQALATGLPPSAQSNAALLALLALRLGERYELAARLLDAALERARQEGHATRQGILHAQRAAIALAQGSLHDAQVEADTGLLLVEKPHFIALLLVAVAITVHIERGELDAAAELARTGEALGIGQSRPRQRLPDRPRAAADRPGPPRRRCRGPAVVRPAARGARAALAKRLEGARGPGGGRAGRQTAGRQARARAAGGGPAGRRARGAGNVAARGGPGDRRGRSGWRCCARRSRSSSAVRPGSSWRTRSPTWARS